MGIAGCTAMDVAALMKKHKQTIQKLEVKCEAELTQGVMPTVFKSVRILFSVEGQIEPAKLEEAVVLSQTKYCGVSAMIAKTAPMTYSIELNGVKIKEGQSQFS
jgi:putative redox protein